MITNSCALFFIFLWPPVSDLGLSSPLTTCAFSRAEKSSAQKCSCITFHSHSSPLPSLGQVRYWPALYIYSQQNTPKLTWRACKQAYN